MLDDEKLVELLVRRDDLLEQCRDATPGEVCEECPELIEEYRARLESLKKTDWLFETDDDDDEVSLSSATASIIDPQLPVSSLTIDQFLRAITDSGLMTTDEIKEFQQSISTDVTSSTQSVARELVHQKRLTLYQASVLLAERSDPLLLDRYVILDTIDSGGMGIVFKALHRSMDRVVALKTLPPSALDSEEKIRRFKREVKTAAMLSHPNIVTTHDAHEANGVYFLVMEYVKGKDLGKVVRDQGPLPVATAVDYVLQAARGLEHAHAQGIIHRDIKPGNLLLDADGTVKVSDVGLARLETSNAATLQPEEELTISGGVMGTAAFMSPEQAANTRNADACSDVYSLGCTMYYLLTGKPPYREDTLINTILAHRDKPIPPLSENRDDIPEEVIAAYRRMMAKKAEDRYQSMMEVIGDLSCHEIARTATLDTTNQYEGKNRRRYWIIGSTVALLAAVGIAMSIIFKTWIRDESPWKPSDPPPAITPFGLAEARQHQGRWAEHFRIPVEFENSIGMKMALIPAGEFMMGASDEEIERFAVEELGIKNPQVTNLRSEGPQHKVRITDPFYIAVHEVTVGEFRVFAENSGYKTDAESSGLGGFLLTRPGEIQRNPSLTWLNPGFEQSDDHPVVHITYSDAQAFCQWLGNQENRKYGLPTDAQWEFACRAGSMRRWCFGDDFAKVEAYAWHRSNAVSTKPVGRKRANNFGLFDMHGNVWERCVSPHGRSERWSGVAVFMELVRIYRQQDSCLPSFGLSLATRGVRTLPVNHLRPTA